MSKLSESARERRRLFGRTEIALSRSQIDRQTVGTQIEAGKSGGEGEEKAKEKKKEKRKRRSGRAGRLTGKLALNKAKLPHVWPGGRAADVQAIAALKAKVDDIDGRVPLHDCTVQLRVLYLAPPSGARYKLPACLEIEL